MGGRGHRYNPRGANEYAPAWTNAAAVAVEKVLDSGPPKGKSAWLAELAQDPERRLSFFLRVGAEAVTADDAANAELVLSHHFGLIRRAASGADLLRLCSAPLASLSKRTASYRRVRPVIVPVFTGTPQTAMAVVRIDDDPAVHARPRQSNDVAAARMRRLLVPADGPLGAVAPSRAASRVRVERPNGPDAEFSRRLIYRDHLPTMTANPADQMLWIGGDQAPRFFHAEETMLASEVLTGEMRRGLLGSDPASGQRHFTAAQVGSVVGAGLHGNSARFVSRVALSLPPGATPPPILRYGSAFTGVDTFAVGLLGLVTGELGSRLSYEYAAESDEKLRAAALRAWGPHGLRSENTLSDARELSWREPVALHLYVLTPSCKPFSAMCHDPTVDAQASVLCSLRAALRVLEQGQPPWRVVIEYVPTATAEIAISCETGRLRAYEWQKLEYCPRHHGGRLNQRKRRFWVGYLGGLLAPPPSWLS